MSETDWMWCFENPTAAAKEIDKLQSVIKTLEAELERERRAQFVVHERGARQGRESLQEQLRDLLGIANGGEK